IRLNEILFGDVGGGHRFVSLACVNSSDHEEVTRQEMLQYERWTIISPG
ncbi:MAG: hypothetical protein RIQ56_943, partial [Candidatus Parcubacteria bacterium]